MKVKGGDCEKGTVRAVPPPPHRQTTQGERPRVLLRGSSSSADTAMANIAVQRIKREFKEVLKSEEVWLFCFSDFDSASFFGGGGFCFNSVKM